MPPMVLPSISRTQLRLAELRAQERDLQRMRATVRMLRKRMPASRAMQVGGGGNGRGEEAGASRECRPLSDP